MFYSVRLFRVFMAQPARLAVVFSGLRFFPMDADARRFLGMGTSFHLSKRDINLYTRGPKSIRVHGYIYLEVNQ